MGSPGVALSELIPVAIGSPVNTRVLATVFYVGGTIAIGGALLAVHAPWAYPDPLLALGLLCAALALSVFKLRLPLTSDVSTLTLAGAVDLLALLMSGADLAMVIAAVGVLVQCTVRVRRPQPRYKTAFSVASVAIAVQAAGWVWRVLDGNIAQPGLRETVIPLAAAAVAYFLVQTTLVVGAIALTSAASVTRSWHREFLWSAPSYFVSAVVAGTIAVVVQREYLLLPLAALPLFISYRAYLTSVCRLEEQRRYARELAAVVASTQEALARVTQSEAALAAEKEGLALVTARLAVTVQTIRDGVITMDRTGSVMLMNEAAQAMASMSEREASELNAGRVFEALGFPAATCEAALHCVLMDGQPAHYRNDSAGPEQPPRLLEVTGAPMRDSDGRLTGAVWVIHDVSDTARLEHERSKGARLESLGVLAGGLAHDFNNILIGVVGNLSLAQTTLRPGDEALAARLRQAEAACVRARGVTNQLLTFAKGGEPVKATASIRELVVECTNFALSGSSVTPRFAIDPGLSVADVDSIQIGQVIQNLVLNARQAMSPGAFVDIMLQNVELDSSESVSGTTLRPGKYVRVTVQDSGRGISAEHLRHIFEPYFTTKEEGSGLGLAISYSIVKAHGGAITVESEPGRGSRFSVYLPASAGSLAIKARRGAVTPRVHTGRVLLMDDDANVAAVARDMLEAIGYVAVVAASGRSAIEQFHEAETRGEPFDVVILDLTVPGGMGGLEAVAHIREIRPDVPVVVTSGYADDSVLARFGDYGFDGVLPKPFAIPDLRRALEEADAAVCRSKASSRYQPVATFTTVVQPAPAAAAVIRV